MVQAATPPANGFVRSMRKVYNPLGFSKGYNFILWFIFDGAFFGFVLARLQYLNIPGIFCGPNNGTNHAAPGECYYYNNFTQEKIGTRLHLYTILPAAFLVVFQFVPVIRHKVILFHRINGYIIILLSLVGIAGALMIARTAFGGTLSTQAYVGALAILTTLGLAMAYYNIKRLQIDQHRAWMLRTWFYFATIITLRIIMIITAKVITLYHDYYFVQPCAKIQYAGQWSDAVLVKLYPECGPYVSGTNPQANAIVNANFHGTGIEVGTSFNVSFGMAGWLALTLHAIGVEIYLHLTPRESERLRNVSYQRQLEAGFKKPGISGITAQRFGDANPFKPEVQGKLHLDSDATVHDANAVRTKVDHESSGSD